jgi:hypothetical protein
MSRAEPMKITVRRTFVAAGATAAISNPMRCRKFIHIFAGILRMWELKFHFLVHFLPFLISSSISPSTISQPIQIYSPDFSLNIHHQISAIYHEFHPDFILLISHIIGPSHVFLEVQDEMRPLAEHHFVFLSQYLTSGVIVVITNSSCSEIPPTVNSTAPQIYCLKGILSKNSEDGFTMESLDAYLQNTTPGFIKFSSSNGLFLQNSDLLKRQQSLFYLRNEYQIYSQLLIEMFLTAGSSIHSSTSTHT